MKILDRYVLVSFVKNYLISLMVLLGLYIVLDMVFNFDELAEVQQKAQIVGNLRDVSNANGQMRGTVNIPKGDLPGVGAEFRISGPDGKGVGTLTVDAISGRDASGRIKSDNADAVHRNLQATAPGPASSAFSVFTSIVSYYYHQSFLFFVQLSGVIPVVAAAFTLIRMSRFNELTAILAAGVPLLRISLPIVYAGVVINFILLPVTQELVVPGMIPELTKKHDELQDSSVKTFPIRAMQDEEGSLLTAGRYTPPDDKHGAHMDMVDVIERNASLDPVGKIRADAADYDPSVGGWTLKNGERVTGLGPNQTRSSPTTVPVWKTSITPEEVNLYKSGDYIELLSTERINQLLQRPKSYGMTHLLLTKHFRWSQLIVNIVLLLLAIPCVMTREPGTLKTDLTKCVVLVGLCMASIFLARQVAGNPPATGNWPQQWPLIMAWIPIFIFLPLAIFLLDQKHAKKT
jgi:lipopolysaccharide export LptBFGC system permease protein LptF